MEEGCPTSQGAGGTAHWNERDVPFEDNVHVLLIKSRTSLSIFPEQSAPLRGPQQSHFSYPSALTPPPPLWRCSHLGAGGLSRPHLLNEGIICRERLLIKGMLMTSHRTEQPRIDPADIVNKRMYNNEPESGHQAGRARDRPAVN